jgi:four helix bundle protein
MEKDSRIHSYKDLIVWQKSMDLVVEIYKITELFPKSEQYGLTSQMRRSSVSIPSNIAEGRKRGSRKDYRQFLIVAYGSGAELETQIEVAKRLKFVDDDKLRKADNLLSEVMKMLNKMISNLKS